MSENRLQSNSISNGDLERLHSEVAQALSARNYYIREIRRVEADLAAKREALGRADEVYRQLKARSDDIEKPRFPDLDDDGVV